MTLSRRAFSELTFQVAIRTGLAYRGRDVAIIEWSDQSGWNENVCPPMTASNMNPSSFTVSTRTPSMY